MNSRFLKKLGFVRWYAFDKEKRKELFEIIPYKKGVYVIKNRISVSRYKGKSDIVYIGSSIDNSYGLSNRIDFYFNPGKTQETSKRIHSYLVRTKGLKISFIVKRNVEKIRLLEKRILALYEKSHWELPPWNRSG